MECLVCKWVVQVPVKKGFLIDLVMEVEKWLKEKGVNKKLVNRVIKRLNELKKIEGIENRNYTICRYCLFELCKEEIKDRKLKELFELEFIKNYDFEGALIC